MHKRIFLKEFVKNIKSMGSITPSSAKLVKTIASKIDFNKSDIIVELGAGTGVITDEIIRRKNPETVFIVFELNKTMFEILNDKYSHIENVYVLNVCASKLSSQLESMGYNKVDYIVSGLPFANFSRIQKNIIFTEIANLLTNQFILFQYTLRLKTSLKGYFNLLNIEKVYFNVPPANVLTLTTNKNSD